jgi:hypothetical protein
MALPAAVTSECGGKSMLPKCLAGGGSWRNSATVADRQLELSPRLNARKARRHRQPGLVA